MNHSEIEKMLVNMVEQVRSKNAFMNRKVIVDRLVNAWPHFVVTRNAVEVVFAFVSSDKDLSLFCERQKAKVIESAPEGFYSFTESANHHALIVRVPIWDDEYAIMKGLFCNISHQEVEFEGKDFLSGIRWDEGEYLDFPTEATQHEIDLCITLLQHCGFKAELDQRGTSAKLKILFVGS